ncbi:MAG TPA: CaiB/BaiF CoA-transferase family protein [Mycobacteriales bacterium]|nr:CaiB/BaiF CoA-transferase family protein [Mycobacteriales bacterium]
MALPLEGLLVVALEQAVSVPHATRVLADLGARVIKIESASGDASRWYDDAVGEVSAYFAWTSRGKESAVLDLKSDGDRQIAERMVAQADVLIQNLAPGSAAKLGLDAASAVARYPKLVAVDISGYGTGGTRDTSRAYDLLVQSESGSCAVTGTPGHPAKPGVAVADIGTAMTASNAILAALFAREHTGQGAAITIAMFDVITDWMSWAYHQARATGENPQPRGMSSPVVSPYGAFVTKDGQTIVIGTTNNGEWKRLATQILGRPDLADDPRYATNADRIERREHLDAVMSEWAAAMTFDEASAAAEAAGIGWARYNTPLEVIDHPHLAARGRWVETPAPGRTFQSLRPPADSAGWSWRVGAVPALGEHTDAIRAEFGGDSAAST